MAAIDWTTTQTALDAALATADGPDLTLLQDVRRRLNVTGTAYDAMWAASTGVDAAKTALATAYSAALAAWASTYTAAHNDADHAARYSESLAVAALTLTSATPYVATVDGVRYVLAPTSAIAVATDETPVASASRTLIAGVSTAELRLVSKLTGTAGNRIEVKVENPTSGAIGKCKITARLVSYTETYDEIAVGDSLNLSASLLLESATWIGGSRPDNAAYAFLTGGTGGSFAAVTERIDRAKKLPSASAQVEALEEYRAALEAAHEHKPRLADFGASSGRDPYAGPAPRALSLHYFGREGVSVRDVEAMLTPIIAEATALMNVASF